MARRGRKPKSKDQKLKDALERNQPADYILERRKLFSFVQPPSDKRQDGRNGEIDSEVCDAIGQLCALKLLDNNGYDPIEMRDKGRFWGAHIARTYRGLGPKVASYERRDRSMPSTATTSDDLYFEKIDRNLWIDVDGVLMPTQERLVLWTLLVDPLIGYRETVPWAQGLIDEALLEKGKVPSVMVFPTETDRHYLKSAIRGLCALVEGSLPSRYARVAA